MMTLTEMDKTVSILAQIEERGGPVILINTFTVPPEDADGLVAAWAEDAAWMKQQPGFVSAQLHRGIAGSGVFLNYAVWESTAAFKAAFTAPEFRARLDHYPASASAAPHLFRKLAVPGICVA
jgi:heme-degrading monooxygenase HmoA